MNRSLALAVFSIAAWPTCGALGAEPAYTLENVVATACFLYTTQQLKDKGESDAEQTAEALCGTVGGICAKQPDSEPCERDLRDYDAEFAKQGDSLLYEAAFLGDEAFVAAMIKAGATIDFRTQLPGVGAATAVGWTPLMIAAAEGHEAIVARLITAGADVNARNARGRTALMFAAGYGFLSIAQALLENGADANIVPNDDTGWPALIAAADAGHEETRRAAARTWSGPDGPRQERLDRVDACPGAPQACRRASAHGRTLACGRRVVRYCTLASAACAHSLATVR